MLRDVQGAEDALQDVWLDVFRAVARLADAGAFRAWLYRIARVRAARELRQRRPPCQPLDEVDARELLTLTLRISGAEVQAVDSAQQALLDLHSFKPDVLLSDIGLPTESGYDLIAKVRALPTANSRIPAVALTAFASEKDRQRALASGFQVHLSKPVDPRTLIEAIGQLVNGRAR